MPSDHTPDIWEAFAAGDLDLLTRALERARYDAEQRDFTEHRDLHDGNVVDCPRPTEGSKL